MKFTEIKKTNGTYLETCFERLNKTKQAQWSLENPTPT